jgi:hypothetical protein
MSKALAALVAALLATGAHADNDDAQLWTQAGISGSLTGPLELHADGALRWFDNGSHLGHVQVRGMLGWRLAGGGLLGAGYTYVRSSPVPGLETHEHRPFQQLNYGIASLGAARLVGRTRLEQRFFDERAGMALRLRQQLRLNIPLKGPEGLRGVIHVEPYFLLHDPAPRAPTGLNQVRTFAGLNIPVAGALSMEVGYMNQHIVAGTDRTNHALSIGFSSSF